MKYSFTIKLNQNDRFLSSINFLRISKTFYFDIIFTVAAIIALSFTIINGYFFNMSTFRKILLIICPLIFPVFQPIILYIKSKTTKLYDKEIMISYDDNNIYVSSDVENATISYKDIYNFYKFKNMIVMMYDSVQGQIIPDRFINVDKDEIFDFLIDRIKNSKGLK